MLTAPRRIYFITTECRIFLQPHTLLSTFWIKTIDFFDIDFNLYQREPVDFSLTIIHNIHLITLLINLFAFTVNNYIVFISIQSIL